MASEVPVLGSTHAEIPRVIGEAGLTFPELDWESMTLQLQRMLDSPDLRSDLASKGRARVLELYTNTRIAEQTIQVYESLLPRIGSSN